MGTRGLLTGSTIVDAPAPAWTTVLTFAVGGAEGVAIYLINDSGSVALAEDITAFSLELSHDDGVTWIPYPFATTRDLAAVVPHLPAVNHDVSLLIPIMNECQLRVLMQVGANDTLVDYTAAPIEDGSRLGRGITIDGMDMNRGDVGVATTTNLAVDNTGTQTMIVNPECDHFMIQNKSLVPVHLNFGTSLAGGAVPSIVLGPCQETAVGSGISLLGTGGAIVEEKFKGTVYAYDPLNTPANITYTEVGSVA